FQTLSFQAPDDLGGGAAGFGYEFIDSLVQMPIQVGIDGQMRSKLPCVPQFLMQPAQGEVEGFAALAALDLFARFVERVQMQNVLEKKLERTSDVIFQGCRTEHFLGSELLLQSGDRSGI